MNADIDNDSFEDNAPFGSIFAMYCHGKSIGALSFFTFVESSESALEPVYVMPNNSAYEMYHIICGAGHASDWYRLNMPFDAQDGKWEMVDLL